jgi:hypothetical protein
VNVVLWISPGGGAAHDFHPGAEVMVAFTCGGDEGKLRMIEHEGTSRHPTARLCALPYEAGRGGYARVAGDDVWAATLG